MTILSHRVFVINGQLWNFIVTNEWKFCEKFHLVDR